MEIQQKSDAHKKCFGVMVVKEKNLASETNVVHSKMKIQVNQPVSNCTS